MATISLQLSDAAQNVLTDMADVYLGARRLQGVDGFLLIRAAFQNAIPVQEAAAASVASGAAPASSTSPAAQE